MPIMPALLAATEMSAMANDAGVGGETALSAAGTMANDSGVGDDAGATVGML